MNTKRYVLVGFYIILATVVLLGTFLFLRVNRVRAVPAVRYVAPGGNCGAKDPCYADIQPALDAAQAGDEILIAGGTYTGVNHALGLAQMAVITKSVTLRGGYAIDDWDHSLPITRPTVLDAGNAGRIFYITGNISPAIENVSIVNGNAAGLGGGTRFGKYSAGGGAFVITATVMLSNTIIKGNHAYVGGGIYIEDSHFSLLNNTILSNTCSLLGGGLFIEGGANSLVNNLFEYNHSDQDAGALSVYHGTTQLSHNRIQENTSVFNGGGVLFYGAGGLINGNTITRNIGGSGGGLDLTGNIIVLNNTISQNTGDIGGGIFLTDGEILLVGNTISGNHSDTWGGGVTIYFNGNPNSEPAGGKILAGNIISGNVATDGGGGLYLEFVHPMSIYNQIIGNHATMMGGGFYIHHSILNQDGDDILKNSTGQDGGGIAIDQGSQLSSANLVLNENTASGGGSALFVQDNTTVELAQATIANNPGRSGIEILSEINAKFFQSMVTMTNTIVTGHTTGITASVGSTVTLNGIFWSGNQTDIDGWGTYIITHIVRGNPAFAPDGYHIGEASAARDTGVPSGILLDIDTEPRPYGKFDLGADEFWPFGILKRFYLPFIYR